MQNQFGRLPVTLLNNIKFANLMGKLTANWKPDCHLLQLTASEICLNPLVPRVQKIKIRKL